jgi:hypothetical protein
VPSAYPAVSLRRLAGVENLACSAASWAHHRRACSSPPWCNRMQILPGNNRFKAGDIVYPVGFRTSRKHISMVNASNKCVYTSEVMELGGKPLYRVTCHDDPPETVENTSIQVRNPPSRRLEKSGNVS